MRENYERAALERAWILACAIWRAKRLAVSDSRGIARAAYLSQITNIGIGCGRKLYKERFQEGQDIMREWVRKKSCCHGITQVTYLGQITNIRSGRVRKL